MNAMAFRTLVVDDEPLLAQAIARELKREHIACDLAATAAQALQCVERVGYQVILLDHRLPDDDGIAIIPRLLARQPKAAVLMMTAYHTIPNAVRAIRQGAEDYIVKETSTAPIIERVLEVKRRHGLRQAAQGDPAQQRVGLLGRSPAMLRVIEQLHQAAASPETTVLLTGEAGAGKEIAARYLHRITHDDERPMVVVDCMASPSNLAESLLFGHEKGSFIGADATRAGAFEQAANGTVFLDEIGDMRASPGKLLRALESRTFRRTGALREVPLLARVVAGTAQDLPAMVQRGAFRLDLYQRLCVFPVSIPPLRERGDDILLLAEHFLQQLANKLGKPVAILADAVCAKLRSYLYPGNVRELKHIIERAIIVCDTTRVELKHLPERVLHCQPYSAGDNETIPLDFVPGIDTMQALEKRMIVQALRRANNVKAEAARLLGISRYQLLRRLEKYGVYLDDS